MLRLGLVAFVLLALLALLALPAGAQAPCTTADPDADGLDECAEIAHGTDPADADGDADGFSDGFEVAAGSDPWSPFSPGPLPILVVTKTADTDDGVCDADCSLREAVATANATPGAQAVALAAGLYPLDGQLTVDDVVHVHASPGVAGMVTLDQQATNERVMEILAPAAVRIEGVRIVGGTAPHGGSSLTTRSTSERARTLRRSVPGPPRWTAS